MIGRVAAPVADVEVAALPAARPVRIVGLLGGRSDLWILAALIAAAAAVRFVALGSQSYWEDESVTAAYTHLPLSGLVHQILHDEGNPPLYFFAAKAWAKLFGSDEAGLRSLSALLGVAVVPIAYAIGRGVSRRAALVTAALVAVNPFLVWYSQEARPYALLVALCAGTLLCLIRALEDGPRRRLWLAGWGATAALALATHFFAYPFVAATAVWLLYGRRDRAALAVTGGVAAVGVALAPLVAGDRGAVSWVHDAGSLTHRSFHVPIELLTGVSEHGWTVAGDTHVRFAAAAAVSCLGLALALTRSSGPARRAAARFIALAFAVLLPTVVLALIRPHADYVYPRYFAPLLLPLLAAIAIGLTGRRLRLAGPLAAAILGALFLSMTVSIAARPSLQRDDWRAIARAIGPVRGARLVITEVATASRPLGYYLSGVKAGPFPGLPLWWRTGPLAGIVVVGYQGEPAFARGRVAPPAPGFTQTSRNSIGRFVILSFTARRPEALDPLRLMRTAAHEFGSRPSWTRPQLAFVQVGR